MLPVGVTGTGHNVFKAETIGKWRGRYGGSSLFCTLSLDFDGSWKCLIKDILSKVYASSIGTLAAGVVTLSRIYSPIIHRQVGNS